MLYRSSGAMLLRANFIYFLVLNTFLFAGMAVRAEALLQILPTRIVLDDKTRTASLTLVNQGDEDASYRMFFRNIRMSEFGQFNVITEKDDVTGERFADHMLRFSPRRITIPARSKQTIRVVARKPADLERGEYRSHMVFRRLPPQTSVLDKETNPELKLAIRPVVEVTIPVIVRHQAPEASLSLSDISVQASQAPDSDDPKAPETMLSVAINRGGDRSLYGDLEVIWKPASGGIQTVGEAKGISVYYPNNRRIFELPLATSITGGTKALQQGELSVSFTENPIYGGELSASSNLKR